MFRRARFSVKPNVRPSAAGRSGSGRSATPPAAGAAAPPDPGAQHDSTPTTCSSATAVGSPAAQQGTPAAAGDVPQSGGSSSHSRDEKTKDAGGDGDHSKQAETVLQRRKRISTMPNLAKPRVVPVSTQRAVISTSKCSQKQAPHSPTFANSPLQKESPSTEKISVDISPKSPILPEKKTPVPQVPQFSPLKKSANKETNTCVTGQRNDEAPQKNTSSPLKERPTQERLIQEEITQSKASEKEKRICSDREKLIKSQKLRKMLKEELKKEKEQRKYKCHVIEKPMPEDRSKMIMRDFIYYLPENNPMKSSLVEEKKTEKTSTVTQAKEPEERPVADLDDENEEDEEEEEEEDGGGEEDGPLLVPRVKVAEDGSIILDEESLTVEVLRTKGQCVVEENDPIFERGSTTTYSSFRKSYYTKPWSEKETDLFFLAISMVGTDFSMISQLFPHRARTEIKNKFKREEKTNGWRIDKAFKEKRPFDYDFFAKLLEKILESERRKKEKDAKCQGQKEKTPNEKKTPKSQKKRKAKIVNGQTSHGQDDLQNARMSDAEMEVDAETAEKENEESPSILEQAEGQAVAESVVMKKKRKKKKKDSECEAENLPEERNIPAEMAEKERSRKKKKNASSSVENNGIGEAGDELEDPDGVTAAETLPLVEREPQRCVQFNEDAEEEHSPTLSSSQDNVFIEAESGELDVPEASSMHHVGQPSKSQMPLNTDKEGFDATDATKSQIGELDHLGENKNITSSGNDHEQMKTDRATAETFTVEEQGQRLESDIAGALEKTDPPVNDMQIRISPAESIGDTEETTVEDKAAHIIGSLTDEMSVANSSVQNESQEAQKTLSEKVEMRGHRQRPKPNIVKASIRKEAPAQGKSNKPESYRTVEKDDVTPEESVERDSQLVDTEVLVCKKSTSLDRSKQPVLKPAPLTRGRMQRPKPNLERAARRQKEPVKSIEADEGKAAAEAEKPLVESEYNSTELLSEDTTEATTYEADIPLSEALANKPAASSVEVILAHTGQSPVKSPLECESQKPQNIPLSNNSVEDVTVLAASDFSLQQEQKQTSAEIELSPKICSLSLKDNLGKLPEKEEPLRTEEERLRNKNETETAEKSLIHITNECIESSNLDEHPAETQEAVTKNEIHLCPQNFSSFKSSEPNEALLSPDVQKKLSVSKQNSEGKSEQSVIQPTALLRGRFQRPKPNIGRAIGRKEMQSVDRKAVAAGFGNEKSELQESGFTRTPSVITQLHCDSKVLPAEVLEERLVDTKEVIQEDSPVPGTSQKISEQISSGKPIFHEDKPCTIKPAQLVRGRFQRARLNLGRMNGKREESVTENVSAPVEGEVQKMEMEKDDLHPLAEDEVGIQASLDNLEKNEGSESRKVPSPKRCINQKKLPSCEKSQRHELLKDQEKIGISASQEISQSKSLKPSVLVRGHLQKPKPNLVCATKRKEASLEGEARTESKTESSSENDATQPGSESGTISTVVHDFRNVVDAASSSESLKQQMCPDSIKTVPLTRSKDSGKCDSSDQCSGSEKHMKKEISKPPTAQEETSEAMKGKQKGRRLKQWKNISNSRSLPTFEHENVHTEKGKKHHKQAKPNVSRGRSLRPALRKKPKKEYGTSKVNLVTLRASSQEEEDDGDDDDDFDSDYEVEYFSPEEVNKAPVFVPKGLRSPNPVPMQIEETMEELEIYETIAEEPCPPPELNVVAQPVMQEDKELHSSQVVFTQEDQNNRTVIRYGSTEAAMTLLAMKRLGFQLNISSQERRQEFLSRDAQNVPDSFPREHNEEENTVHCNVACSALSKNELVSSDPINKAATEDCSTEPSGLEDCLLEATNVPQPVSSKNVQVSSHSANKAAPEYCDTPCTVETAGADSCLSSCNRSKTSGLPRCRFPKPKPNLYKGLGLNQSASQKSGFHLEQTNVMHNEGKVSESVTEEEKVVLEQNFMVDKLAKNNFAEKQDLQPGSAGTALQTNNMERESVIRETSTLASELNAPKFSPEAETCLFESPDYPNRSTNVQTSGPVEHQLSTVEIVQSEASKYSSISATTEMTAVNGDNKDYPDTEEEPTFILTLVEISPDTGDCSGLPAAVPQSSEQLLPPPVFLTPNNMNSVQLAKAESIGSITASVEENAFSIGNTGEKGVLQEASIQQADLDSVSCKNLKRCAAVLEESGDPPKKKKSPVSAEKNLESSDKEISHELKCIPRKATEKSSTSKKKISSTSKPVSETAVLQVEKRAQPSLNLGPVLLDEAARTNEQESRTLHEGKAKISGERRNFVDTCKSVQSEQVGSPSGLPKSLLSRSYQRTLGFLPLICKNNNFDEEVTEEDKQSLQKTDTVLSENTTECPNLTSKDNNEEIPENNSFPSTNSLPSKCENGASSTTVQIFSDLPENKGSSKEQEKEEEPTKISEYFFSDIFMEVDDSE
ncbi:transcription factor TFIIIB component B'' homolog isoform X3 [Varanus komodoensis]|uniref:transcription factor TFIIIB component B'' homolog isoform X3 n=1 Tax=Varanus komodoensis TaxID=61221 RepID=UPI001CF7AD53|nr:transcription factor TFIIIB component B'' homolog isoform X3 [Varanus komodoensis]